MQDAEAIRRVISIVRTRLADKPVVVVSALAKVTRLLVQIAEEAESGNMPAIEKGLTALRERHLNLCADLLEGGLLEETGARVGALCDSLSDFAGGVCRIGELSPRSRARIVSTGEVLSSTIVSAAFNAAGIPCKWLDARQMVVTDDNYMSAGVNRAETRANVLRIIPEAFKGEQMVLTQGFIASTGTGATSVLGFEGSDYSAALFGMSLDAERVEIWTDVDGIRTSDPRVVERTGRIPHVSYDEAAVMACLGARVLHPLTMGPARSRNIPIRVLNTMNPEGEGTVVAGEGGESGPKCLAFLPEIDYVEVVSEGFGPASAMTGDIFRTLEVHGAVPSLAASSVSKVSLSFECGQDGLPAALEALSGKYGVTLYRDKAQISVVGRGVALDSAVSEALCTSGPVHMLSAGADMMSLSAVTDREGFRAMAGRIHERLFLDND